MKIDATTAAKAVGHEVEITGLAQDAKLSAVVVDGDLIVYLLDRPSWGAQAGTRVIVRGMLEHTHDLDVRVSPSGAISQGVSGAGLYAIHGATVEPAR